MGDRHIDAAAADRAGAIGREGVRLTRQRRFCAVLRRGALRRTLSRCGLFPAGGPLGLGRFRFLSRSRNRLTGDIGCTIISGNSRGTFAIITVRALCQSGVIIAGKGVCHRSIGVHLTKHLAFGEFREAAVILNGGCFFIRLVHRGQQLIQIAAISGRRHISLRFIRGRSVLHGNRGLRSGIFLLQQFFFLGCHK